MTDCAVCHRNMTDQATICLHCTEQTTKDLLAIADLWRQLDIVRCRQTRYTHVEVGFPSQRPELWRDWEAYAEDPDEPTRTVYGYVPLQLVQELVTTHGGEANETTQR